MTEERRCEFCGQELKDGESRCPSCGGEVFFNDAKRTRNTGTVLKAWKKGGRTIAYILIFVLLFANLCVMNRKTGKIEEEERKEAWQRKLDERVQEAKEKEHSINLAAYVPGNIENGKFVSGHFDFQIDLDERWAEIPQEDLEEYEKTRRKDAIDTDKAIIKNETKSKYKDISEEELDKELKKWEDTYYFEVEYGGVLLKNNEFAGEFAIVTCSALGVADTSIDKYVENVKNALGKDATNVTTEYVKIADSHYSKIQWEPATTKDTTATVFVRKRNGIMCQIECRAPKKYSDEFVASLLESISYYEL